MYAAMLFQCYFTVLLSIAQEKVSADLKLIELSFIFDEQI